MDFRLPLPFILKTHTITTVENQRQQNTNGKFGDKNLNRKKKEKWQKKKENCMKPT